MDNFNGLFDSIRTHVQESLAYETSFMEDFLGFVHAIDWKEPFILGLMAFHLCFCVTIYLSSSRRVLEMVLLAVIGKGSATRTGVFQG